MAAAARGAEAAGVDNLGYWLRAVPGDDLRPRPSLDGDEQVDVAIVGAGYTGLWIAYYLLVAEPSLRVLVVEKEVAGFGAAGRNAGWCVASMDPPLELLARTRGRETALRLFRAVCEAVDEIGAVAAAERLDADYVKGGSLTVTTNPAQEARMRRQLANKRRLGLGDGDFRWLSAAESNALIAVAGCRGAIYTPHCASVQPAALARRLADAVERHGGRIHEQTAALSVRPGEVLTTHGRVRAGTVVLATEGYTATLPDRARFCLPLYAWMIATEPLPDWVWQEVGWRDHEALTDGRHLSAFAVRAADGRITLGGVEFGYFFGSDVSARHEYAPRVFNALQALLHELVPQTRGARVTHCWGGPFGMSRRRWKDPALVYFDRRTGFAMVGGYFADGVAPANLAARAFVDSFLRRDTPTARLPLVSDVPRAWEPEPLRWLALSLSFRALRAADIAEGRRGRPTLRGAIIDRLYGE